jgi:hypothetical protein
MKTIAIRFCAYYEKSLKPIVDRAPECIRDYIKPRFAVFKFKAFLGEIKEGAGAAFLQEGIRTLPEHLESQKIGTKYFREFVREDAAEILSAMTVEMRMHLFHELLQFASRDETSKKCRDYCRILQHKIVELAVLPQKEELLVHCSSVLSISGKNKNAIEDGLTSFREITNRIFNTFTKKLQDLVATQEGQIIQPGVKGVDAQSKMDGDSIREWILEAALPSEKEVKSLMKGINLRSKMDLLKRIGDISQSDQSNADIWEKLYERVDSSSNFGTPEFLAKQKDGLLQPGPKTEPLTAKQ